MVKFLYLPNFLILYSRVVSPLTSSDESSGSDAEPLSRSSSIFSKAYGLESSEDEDNDEEERITDIFDILDRYQFMCEQRSVLLNGEWAIKCLFTFQASRASTVDFEK